MIKRTFADIPIFEFDEIDSTNKFALDNLNQLEDDFSSASTWLKAVISANFQSIGKGRRGREWVSNPNTSVLASFVVDPKFFGTMLDTTLMISTINQILCDLGVPSKIKWPNDIVIENDGIEKTSKLSGVLTQIAGDYLVIGVGINVIHDIDIELENISYLHDYNMNILPRELLEKIVTQLSTLDLNMLLAENVLKDYKLMSSSLFKNVRVETMGENYEGIVIDFSPTGALIVELPDSRTIELSEGDVIHLR